MLSFLVLAESKISEAESEMKKKKNVMTEKRLNRKKVPEVKVLLIFFINNLIIRDNIVTIALNRPLSQVNLPP